MDATRASLLIRVRNPGDREAWREFDGLYRPLMMRYARAAGLAPADAEDIAQQCLVELIERMPQFKYAPERGGFRRWLRVFVRYRIRNHMRRRRDQSARTGDFRRPQSRERVPAEVWEQIWLQEHLAYCLEQVRSDIDPQTYEIFRRYVLDEWSVTRVCKTLGVTPNQVYITKTRVAERLRKAMTALLGEAA